ncbi:hypothetical protein QE250_11120 [Chromatiaceae bacterium AAb-1]|nr:hypothetical protein [Chromatiaceae bacterium AAb-1]
MVRLLFLVPLIMFIGWYIYLNKNGWSIRQGWKGFVAITVFNGVIAVSLWIIMLLSRQSL